MVNAQKSIVIEVDLLFVMARTATLNWEIPIGVPGLGVFWGYFDTMVMWQLYFWCLSKFKEMLKDTGLFKSTKSAPLAGLYGHFLEFPIGVQPPVWPWDIARSLTTKMNCRVKNIPGSN
jgi:hypothetical protein